MCGADNGDGENVPPKSPLNLLITKDKIIPSHTAVCHLSPRQPELSGRNTAEGNHHADHHTKRGRNRPPARRRHCRRAWQGRLGTQTKEAGSRACLFASKPGKRYLRRPLNSARRGLATIDNLEQRSVYTHEIEIPLSERLSFFPCAGLLDRVDKRFSRHRLKLNCG